MDKILHVLTDTNIGGAGRYFFNLVSSMDKSRFEIVAACPAGGELERQIKLKGIPTFQLTGGESSFSKVHVREIYNIISKQKIDIVHTHASFSGRIAGKLAGCKVVLTRHGLARSDTGIINRGLTYLLSKMFTDKIIAVSRAVKINLIETGVPADMINIIHNGIDLSSLESPKPVLRSKYKIPIDTPVVGIVARLVIEKGYEYALRAIKYVKKEYPNVLLVVVGDGPQEHYLKSLCNELDLTKNVIFLGYKQNVENIVADFDVFVLPSVSEGLGLAMLEAMAIERPVIATEVGGIPEVIKHKYNGMLVPPKDEKALADYIIHVLSSPDEARTMGKNAKITIIERFSAKSMAKKTSDIYEEIL
jgi:glycosyltransferase involved in cell wall biosynthesis